jgi:predicted Rossmann-fold nucleotide-binding protein
MKNFEHLLESLEGFGVPLKRLDALKRMIDTAASLKQDFADAGLSSVSSSRLQTIIQSFLISSTAMFLLKKYSGKQILVVWGSARGNVIYPGTVQYDRVERVCAMAGPGWIIVHGGGDAIMDAARQGGKRGGSPTVALHFDSEYSYQGNQGLTDTVNLYHSEFYSRLFSFLEYADAVLIDEGGLGTLQEKSWVEGCVQCKFHEQLPIFTLCKAFFANVRNHFQQLLEAKLCYERDRDLMRHVEPGEEDQVFARIAEYYARRPELVEKRRLALVSQDEVVATQI